MNSDKKKRKRQEKSNTKKINGKHDSNVTTHKKEKERERESGGSKAKRNGELRELFRRESLIIKCLIKNIYEFSDLIDY